MLAKPSLTIRRRFSAPPAKVFAAWTDPDKLTRWMGAGELTKVVAECDLRVGGRYRILMQQADGQQHEVSGVYREIVPDERLVFSWAWKSTPERESIVSVTFAADGDGTLMTLLHEQFFDEDARRRHEFGWTGSFEKLERLLA